MFPMIDVSLSVSSAHWWKSCEFYKDSLQTDLWRSNFQLFHPRFLLHIHMLLTPPFTRQQQNFLHNPGTISLTLTSSSVAQLQLLLLVGQFVDVLLTEYRVQVSLVSSIRDADKDREEEEGEHRLPDLHLVFGVDHEDDDQPDICEYRGDSCDAEDKKVTNPGTCQISATSWLISCLDYLSLFGWLKI